MTFACEGYGYKLVNRYEFFRLPLGMNGSDDALANRAAEQRLQDRVRKIGGTYVLYDPADDGEGFLLVGNNANELDAEFMAHHGFELKGNENA